MSAFDVKITPPRIKRSQENREPTTATMAPYSEKSVVIFEDVPLTKTAIRLLHIVNPLDDAIQVKVIKNVRPEHNLTLEWTENIVPSHSTVAMKIKWTPYMELVCKETLQLIDNRNFVKDISIVLKTKSNDIIKNVRKFPTLSSCRSKSCMPRENPKNSATSRGNKSLQHRNNILVEESSIFKKNYQQNIDHQLNKVPAILHKSNDIVVQKISTTLTPDGTHGENIGSPITGVSNVLTMIDQLQFTPVATPAKSKSKQLTESMPLVLTPNIPMCTEKDVKITQSRPKCLELDLLNSQNTTFNIDPVKGDNKPSISVIINKTYDVKRSDSMEQSVGNISSTCFNTDTECNNKTTVVGVTPLGFLDIIPEVENENNSNLCLMGGRNTCSTQLNNALKLNKNEDLLRDVELIGNPLRNCSKSLKHLNERSSNSNNITQGSLPNLNEMETIRIFERNRYFKQASSYSGNINISTNRQMGNETELDGYNKMAMDSINYIDNSLFRHSEETFNQCEILAQSSRFNLNETNIDYKWQTLPGSTPFQYKREPVTPLKSKNYNRKVSDNVHTASKRSASEISLNADFTTVYNDTNKMCQPINRVNCDNNTFISPPKRQRLDMNNTQYKLQRHQITPSNKSRITDARGKALSHTQMSKVKQNRTASLVSKSISPRTDKDIFSQKMYLYDSKLHMPIYINPDPFAATTTLDPFLTSTMYLDEVSIERYQIDLKKWLNALVMIPAELKTGDSNTKIDVGKLFNEARNKELILAPTKEMQSIKYFNNFRLEALRRAAIDLYFSQEMGSVCSKVILYINKGSIRIRNDRNLHLNVVIQRDILELLLCFNSLWLRLGLEVVFGEKIHLVSNCDIVGLSSFILNRLFRNKHLEQQHSKAYSLRNEYSEQIKKFTLQKFLLLLLFLDKAKAKRIIAHDPCLFVKKSPYKETREILLKFSTELLANVGDITRELKRLDYVLTHKQSYLDEYDYALNNLAVDLRDGVRLTRIMEIILLRDDLTRQLRVPAISRLQKIFNVNLALKALSEADFQLNGNISAHDIVDGHREKTLSLLWQIIYKFRSPKFHAAAKILQQWWRKSWLKIVIDRRIRNKIEQKRQHAAIIIQSAYRGYINRKYAKMYRTERTGAAITLQKYVRRYLAQKYLIKSRRSVLIIQRWFRACKLRKLHQEEYMQLRKSVMCIQRRWRLRKEARAIRATALQHKIQREISKRKAAVQIQAYWRCYIAQKTFLKVKTAIIVIQRYFRSYKQMKDQRYNYQETRRKIVHLQNIVRARQAMKRQFNIYTNKRNAIISIQRWYRSIIAMRQQRTIYLKMRSSVLYIQLKWRATLLMKEAHANYFTLKKYTIIVQQIYRAKKQMQIDFKNYKELKAKVLWTQRFYRNKLRMHYEREIFKKKVQAVRVIQNHFRAYREMRNQRKTFCIMKNATICLQQHVRNYLKMKYQRQKYLKIKWAAQIIQRHFRNYHAMKCLRYNFLQTKSIIIRIQRRFRSKRLMLYHVNDYQKKRSLIIAMQRRYRAKLLGRKVRQQFLMQRNVIIHVQRKYRALKMMQKQKAIYQHIRLCIIKIQRHIRNYLLMKKERVILLRKLKAVRNIQIWYRAILIMKDERQLYLNKLKAIILIQNKWRAIVKGRKQRIDYLNIRSKVILLQRKMRATIQMRSQRELYKRQRAAAITLQCYFRSRRQMLTLQVQYKLTLSVIIRIQRKYRAKVLMLKERTNFLNLRRVVINLQRIVRARNRAREERLSFLKFKVALLNFQSFARGYLARQRFQILTSPEMMEFLRENKATRIIQRVWRGYRVRKRIRNTVLIQIRRNIILFNKTSNAINAISVKIQDAIGFLRGRYCVADAINVLKRLDNISRTVPHVMIKHSDYISTFCYGIMAQSIRSETDKYLVMFSSRILLNLARYNHTNANTFQENGLVTIAQMLLRWCSKDCDIFNTLCTLIWVFAHCQVKRKIIHDFMTTTDAVYMVRETKKLVARKEKMKQNVRKPIIQQEQQRSVKQYNYVNCALPHLEPDYGIIYKKPYIFVSSVFAFDTILNKLGIQVF